jgi:hypothetical protein
MCTRQFILSLLLVCTGQVTTAQQIPVTETPYLPVAVPLPPAYPRSAISYIRTWQPHMPATNPLVIKAPSTTIAEVQQTTEYLDGAGRRLQVVEKSKSPSGRDVVTPVLYDASGRENFKYLPYVPLTGNTNDGKFKTDPFAGQQEFYSNQAENPGANNESYFFYQTDYAPSPLERVEKTYLPGNAYTKTDGNKPRQYQYLTNSADDSIRIWRFTAAGILPVAGQVYPAGVLYKNVTTDEAGTLFIEYKDMEGHVILNKQQAGETPATGHTGWACTYYTYDDLGRLRVVIPPKAVQAIQADWIITPAIAAALCAIYRYDGRGRMIVSKQPASDSAEQIYDSRNRLIVSRTGILKNRGMWQVYYYDELNRDRTTGLFFSSATREQLQTWINSYPYNPAIPVPALDTSYGYTLLAYTNYDNYMYAGAINYSAADAAKVEAGSNPYTEPLPATPVKMPQGLITGKKVAIAGSSQQLETCYYYNDKGRLTQTLADNIMGGQDITSYLYDFDGKLISTYFRQTNPKSTVTPQTTLLTLYYYDATGRQDIITKRLNDDPSLQQNVAIMEYDELGRIKTKKLSASGTAVPLELQAFQYDLRGHLAAINKSFVNTPNSISNWFGQEISYETGFTSKYYNGNIAGVKWKGGSNGAAMAYGYHYDPMNRLTAGDFTQQHDGSTSWTSDKVDFSLKNLSYDINGNILSMKQTGMNGMAIQTIDSLQYHYLENSNQLNYVTDLANHPQSILGDFIETVNTPSPDYSYDPDGNMSKDKNKDIDSIIYDQNNHPAIVILKKGFIYLQHNSLGQPLLKVIIDTSAAQGSTRVIHYANGFVYEQDTLRLILHDDGRIRPVYKTGATARYTFDAFIKDGQGNVREVLGANGDTAQYFASMETGRNAVENALFSNIDNTRAVLPSGYPADNFTSPNSYLAKLNGVDGAKIGPSLVLRVMRGDTIAAIVRAFYKSEAANTSSNSPGSMLAALLQAFSAGGVSQGTHTSAGPNSPLATSFSSIDYQQLQVPFQQLPWWPKAYMSYVLFDDQFKMTDANSGIRQVQGPPDALLSVVLPSMVIRKSGFLYIYLSNESAADVYFDNFIVQHLSGPLLEETHYYPFGLTMAGISAMALKSSLYPENKYRYRSHELHNREMRQAPGLDWYNEGERMYDVQIGRWFSTKPLSGRVYNPYMYRYNHPEGRISIP